MTSWFKKRDILRERFGTEKALQVAESVLTQEEQSEEAFLGAQGILLLHGLI